MAKGLNLERKKRKLKRLSIKKGVDTVLLNNGKIKEYGGERYNALIIYKHKLKRFVDFTEGAGNERVYDTRNFYGELTIGNHYLPFGITNT